MSPLKKLQTRGKGKAVATFDHHRFISRETEAAYLESFGNKTLIPERGFELKGSIMSLVGEEVESRGWRKWVEPPKQAQIERVKEFYANLMEAKLDKSWVLGRWVSFTPKDINRVLEIPEAERYDLETFRIDEIADMLCPGGAQWTMKNGRYCHFPKRDMTEAAQAWLYFICARLLPATHYTEVTPDRARVIYAIMEGIPINVGKIIYREILRVTPQRKSLPFPTLITLLNRAAGPEERPGEITYLESMPPITERTLSRISSKAAREQRQQGAGSSRKRPIKAMQEEVEKLKRKMEKMKNHNMAWWKLWAKKNKIPESELPHYETSTEEEESEGEAPSDEEE